MPCVCLRLEDIHSRTQILEKTPGKKKKHLQVRLYICCVEKGVIFAWRTHKTRRHNTNIHLNRFQTQRRQITGRRKGLTDVNIIFGELLTDDTSRGWVRVHCGCCVRIQSLLETFVEFNCIRDIDII